MAEFITGTGQKLTNVHNEKYCKGPCPIHNPSDHHMKDWPLHWREDRRMFERICPCSIGHPDPDDLSYKATLGIDVKTEAIHGCCGCCNP